MQIYIIEKIIKKLEKANFNLNKENLNSFKSLEESIFYAKKL